MNLLVYFVLIFLWGFSIEVCLALNLV